MSRHPVAVRIEPGGQRAGRLPNRRFFFVFLGGCVAVNTTLSWYPEAPLLTGLAVLFGVLLVGFVWALRRAIHEGRQTHNKEVVMYRPMLRRINRELRQDLIKAKTQPVANLLIALGIIIAVVCGRPVVRAYDHAPGTIQFLVLVIIAALVIIFGKKIFRPLM